ncbi:uncharacterized protein F5891DRAFT_979166 [Suillus fuscotomentosus]|uniref:F-box domain-containing protein n=1 Tax=Suillus fuscotomentosus TaxID=1912939 RepID=A0AAD4EBR6_9AGAM|nr:uncharacterized protein F5891DRAFT_979166 [Suillus fuscotomentosus]KAG1902059.1 hypothetical protein F5891DRAFT_979166 [Suillus fuscotomentosus]
MYSYPAEYAEYYSKDALSPGGPRLCDTLFNDVSQVTSLAHEDAQGSESLPVEVQDTKPVTSRVRKGGLSLLPIISLDVLFDLKHYLSQQIVGFLEPLDLLDLARTSKAF